MRSFDEGPGIATLILHDRFDARRRRRDGGSPRLANWSFETPTGRDDRQRAPNAAL